MAIYALWNNKGGVGKSYLSFQIASEYARSHPEKPVLVVDLCPQANASSMLLGGIIAGERHLSDMASQNPRLTIAGYIEQRILTPYQSPRRGASYLVNVAAHNKHIPKNLFLVVGDEELEVQASRVSNATTPGPADAWRLVHTWISDLIADIRRSWNLEDSTVFIDCNPSFGIYTELAMSASDRLIIPFAADGSSKRAVRAVLSLLYGIRRTAGAGQSEFFLKSQQFRMSLPQIYCYVGNRLTQGDFKSAIAFETVVEDIGKEIRAVWTTHSNHFAVHPKGAAPPRNGNDFRKMFQAEIKDANSASVVSGALGIPIFKLSAGTKTLLGKSTMVNQTQLNRQQPNMRSFVATIE